MQKLFSEDLERTLVGCMLLDNSVIDNIMSILKKDYFQIAKYSLYFQTITELYAEHDNCDIIMLSQALPEYTADIADLTSSVATAANYEIYANQIRKFYIARRFKQFFDEKKESLSESSIDEILYDSDDFINGCMTNVSKIEPVDSKKFAMDFIEDMRHTVQRKGQLEGFDTGYEQLNAMIGGLQTGNLITIGARPSIGKSAFADQLNTNLMLNKIPTVTFSLEMTKKEISRRRVACLTSIPLQRIKSGYLSQSQVAKINMCCQKLFDTDSLLYDSSTIGFDFNEIVSRIRVHAKQGYKVFFIDHIGLLEYGDGGYTKDFEKISQMTKRLKKLAATLDVAIVIICQLTRDSEGKEPLLNSLRGSGSIEQDSNIVMFLHRARQVNNEQEIPTKLMVVKDRDGACGDINFDFLPATTLFRELDKDGNIITKTADDVKLQEFDQKQEATSEIPF